MILSSIWGQKFLVFTILSVSVSGEQDTSQLGYGSSDLGYGPLHPGENSVQAQKAALSSYASNSDRHPGGMSPFSSGGTSMSSSGTGSMGQGGSRMSSPFSANSGGSGMQIPVTASSGSSPNGGTAAGPFSSATGGQGSSGGMASSPFSVAGLGNGGGMGSNPFSTGSGSGTGSGPFSASSNLGGTDMSSLLGTSGGPGGLGGGNFAGDASTLMGHDFSVDLVGSSVGGVYSGAVDGSGSKGQSQYGIDATKFDTTEYEKMLDQLFNPDTYDKELLASPFHGETSKLPQSNNGQGQGHGFETSHESSIGSYASTDMSSSVYAANSGSFQSSYNGGHGQTYVESSNSGSGQENFGGSGGILHSPFETSHLSTGESGTYSHGAQAIGTSMGSNSGMTANTPFKISDAEKGETPFKINGAAPGGISYGMNIDSPFKINAAEKGNTPFKINGAGQGMNPYKITGTTGGGPFDTSKFSNGNNYGNTQSQTFESLSGGQHFGGGSDMLGQAQLQSSTGTTNINGLDQYGNVDFSKLTGLSGNGAGTQYQSTSGTSNNNGLDQYGNVDFEILSGLSGNEVDLGNTGTNFGSLSGSSSYSKYSGSTHIDYSSGKPGYNIGVNTGVSESQFKTPFESDNYNDLLGNPFDSSSDFNSNHENFNQPFSKGPSQAGGLQTYQGLSGSAGSAGLQTYQSNPGSAGLPNFLGGQSNINGQGPAGDPFNQGGSRMHG